MLVLKDKKGKAIKDGHIVVYDSPYLKLDKQLKKEFNGTPFVARVLNGDYYFFWNEHSYKFAVSYNNPESQLLHNQDRYKIIGNIGNKGKNYRQRSGYLKVNNVEEFSSFVCEIKS